MEGILVVRRLDELITGVHLAQFPTLVLAPAENLHLVVGTQAGIPVPGAAREFVAEIQSGASGILEAGAATRRHSELSAGNERVDLSPDAAVDVGLAEELEGQDMVFQRVVALLRVVEGKDSRINAELHACAGRHLRTDEVGNRTH